MGIYRAYMWHFLAQNETELKTKVILKSSSRLHLSLKRYKPLKGRKGIVTAPLHVQKLEVI